jgi:hypothetical protein
MDLPSFNNKEINMSSFLLFVMVACLFVHTFFNFFLKVYATVVSKVSGIATVEYSVEDFFGKVFAAVFNWFKKLLAISCE